MTCADFRFGGAADRGKVGRQLRHSAWFLEKRSRILATSGSVESISKVHSGDFCRTTSAPTRCRISRRRPAAHAYRSSKRREDSQMLATSSGPPLNSQSSCRTFTPSRYSIDPQRPSVCIVTSPEAVLMPFASNTQSNRLRATAPVNVCQSIPSWVQTPSALRVLGSLRRSPHRSDERSAA